MFTDTRLEKEIINENGIQEYSLMEKLVLSHKNYDITVPRNTITIYTTKHEIVYHWLRNQRTVPPMSASWIYLYAMKSNNIPFFKRWWIWFKSLKNWI